ncbi:hypothetical protein B0T19DRAFT_39820 [Cercophora scortea]|uniref:Uncharacterized protein n=1 Tax=Cercophora scortea TaxID=314031 RepID=A0AAE0MMG4_9PEZI|nr:hypothetical protein B0T19DRAFT_39820 [Cercophora scortea]
MPGARHFGLQGGRTRRRFFFFLLPSSGSVDAARLPLRSNTPKPRWSVRGGQSTDGLFGFAVHREKRRENRRL